MSRFAKPKILRASENDIAFGVLVVAAFQVNGIASFHRLKIELPIHLKLSNFDKAESIMRPSEEMWMQKLRDIILNREKAGNFIHEGFLVHLPHVGFQITPAGQRRRLGGRHGDVREGSFMPAWS